VIEFRTSIVANLQASRRRLFSPIIAMLTSRYVKGIFYFFLFSMQFDKFTFFNPKRKKEKEKVAGDLVRNTKWGNGQMNLASEISKTLHPINLLVKVGGAWRRGTASMGGGGN
jgi:hypothetical protein